MFHIHTKGMQLGYIIAWQEVGSGKRFGTIVHVNRRRSDTRDPRIASVADSETDRRKWLVYTDHSTSPAIKKNGLGVVNRVDWDGHFVM